MLLAVGSKVKFKSEVQRYTVQASDERFAICTKPMNALHTVLYTIIDFDKGVRGTEDLIFGMGAETREQCEDMLDRLNGRPDSEQRFLVAVGRVVLHRASQVSYRNRCALDIQEG
jgi:hypothetical protein